MAFMCVNSGRQDRLSFYTSLLLHWHPHMKLHQPIIAIHLDVAVMGIHDCFSNGKAQAIMLILAIPGGIHAVESLKDPLPEWRG